MEPQVLFVICKGQMSNLSVWSGQGWSFREGCRLFV